MSRPAKPLDSQATSELWKLLPDIFSRGEELASALANTRLSGKVFVEFYFSRGSIQYEFMASLARPEDSHEETPSQAVCLSILQEDYSLRVDQTMDVIGEFEWRQDPTSAGPYSYIVYSCELPARESSQNI